METDATTSRVDSKLLASAKAGAEAGGSRAELAEALRRTVATVGEPGEQVRGVISVGMLTEGWDAQNVIQVFGLRAFQAQLLGAPLRIPYTFAGGGHNFFPDFLVRLVNGATLVLEVKGYEDEQDRAKYAAAGRWCEAVSNWGQMGRWLFDHSSGPESVKAVLARKGTSVS